jgi:hypothetical protein
MARTTFPETALVRLPAGTLDLIRVAAEQDSTTPAEVMRRALVSAVKAAASPQQAERHARQ